MRFAFGIEFFTSCRLQPICIPFALRTCSALLVPMTRCALARACGTRRLSTFTIGKSHWEERYFVLTKKGLHYYVRQREESTESRRDLFGEHEGSIAIGNIARIELPRPAPGSNKLDDEMALTFTIVSKNNGRRFVLRAGTAELYDRWVSTLQAAVDPASSLHSRNNSGTGSILRASGSWNPLAHRGSSSSSFPRIPTLLDFRSGGAPRTDNIVSVTLYSSVLDLHVLLESGLPWGMPTTIARTRHRVTAILAPHASFASTDSLQIQLQGGATATIPLVRTLLRRPKGSALVALQSPTMHKAIKLTWDSQASPGEDPSAAQTPHTAQRHHHQPSSGSPRGGGAAFDRTRVWVGAGGSANVKRGTVAYLLSLLTSTSLISAIAIAFALVAPESQHDGDRHVLLQSAAAEFAASAFAAASAGRPEAPAAAQAATSAAERLTSRAASARRLMPSTEFAPALGSKTRWLLLTSGALLLLLELFAALPTVGAFRGKARGEGKGGGGGHVSAMASPLRVIAAVVRRLPSWLVMRLPSRLSRAVAAAELPAGWNITLEPATTDREGRPVECRVASGVAPSSPLHHPSSTSFSPLAPLPQSEPASPLPAHAPRGRAAASPQSPPAGSPTESVTSGTGGSDSASGSELSSSGAADAIPETELQMDALFADVASAEHSILYHAAIALREARLRMNGPGGLRGPQRGGAQQGGAGGGIGGGIGGGGDGEVQEEAYPANGGALVSVSSWGGDASAPAATPASGSERLRLSVINEPNDFNLESLLTAFEHAVVAVLSALGPAMLILVKNDEGNLRKMREAARKAAAAASGPLNTSSVRALIEDELQRGVHTVGEVVPPTSTSPAVRFRHAPHQIGNGIQPGSTGGATLCDPSAAMSLLWLRRSLNFTILIMENLQAARQRMEDEATILPMLDEFDPEEHSSASYSDSASAAAGASMMADPVVDCVCEAYDQVMRPFHAWILRKTFDLVSTQIPTLPQMVACLGPGLGENDVEGKVFRELTLFLEEARPVAQALDELYAELKLEDLRQV